MLALSRKVGETIRIGETIVIHVTKIGGGRVALGIDAPPHLPVHRGEVVDRINRGEESPHRFRSDEENPAQCKRCGRPLFDPIHANGSKNRVAA